MGAHFRVRQLAVHFNAIVLCKHNLQALQQLNARGSVVKRKLLLNVRDRQVGAISMQERSVDLKSMKK